MQALRKPPPPRGYFRNNPQSKRHKETPLTSSSFSAPAPAIALADVGLQLATPLRHAIPFCLPLATPGRNSPSEPVEPLNADPPFVPRRASSGAQRVPKPIERKAARPAPGARGAAARARSPPPATAAVRVNYNAGEQHCMSQLRQRARRWR